MRNRIGWLGIVAGILLAPCLVQAQDSYGDVPPVPFTAFLSHPRVEDGGFYTAFGFLYWNTNRVLASQSIAKRGFMDNDGSITKTPKTFVGSGEEALNTNQVMGPRTYQPGWDINVGYKFQSGISVELNWKHLMEAAYHASASILPPSFNVGGGLENTFLFSPVSNFPQEWAGAAQKVAVGSPTATYGIWNAASLMEIQYVQRFDIYQVNARLPIWQTDSYRTYGLFGPRISWLWDQFRWRTVDYDAAGNTTPDTAALYTNTVSNRMYGAHVGFGNDWYLGSTPIGSFGFELECEGSLYMDFVRTSAAYTRLDNAISASRNRRLYSLVPGVESRLGITYYPWEAIQLHFGYDVMMFFNTMASTKPVDFNLGNIDPQYEHVFFRWYQGMTFSITLVF